jgi:hypothetical protein
MSPEDLEMIDMRAELKVRRYFDHYLDNVLPKQLKQVVKAHDESSEAHGGIVPKFSKFKWLLVGFSLAAGGVGAGIRHLFGH